MELKTKQEIVNQAKAYLTKTSQHLFVTPKGVLYHIESFERDGKLYYATIFIDNDKLMLNVKEAVTDRQYAWAGNNTLSLLQNELFPAYLKVQSIPYFKKMRALVAEILADISVYNAINEKLAGKLKERLSDLVLVK